MAIEVFGSLSDCVNPVTEKSVKLAYGGEEETFLREVIIPIYEMIAKEAERSKRGRLAHSQWRNYDDLNEYFWSDECFGQLGWSMSADADFFHLPAEQLQFEKTEDSKPAYHNRWVGKVNFVEIRSFWHISEAMIGCGASLFYSYRQ
ncbi:callose synthase 3-like [Syzygium oleosum]|uniref:callose synthase 3-like n=1 Tax=Syzygium oleosum TaxID=219896 RepID=UPI0011D2634C|nr:callose synthase 3-like [Syzygium oleosum]